MIIITVKYVLFWLQIYPNHCTCFSTCLHTVLINESRHGQYNFRELPINGFFYFFPRLGELDTGYKYCLVGRRVYLWILYYVLIGFEVLHPLVIYRVIHNYIINNHISRIIDKTMVIENWVSKSLVNKS